MLMQHNATQTIIPNAEFTLQKNKNVLFLYLWEKSVEKLVCNYS